MDVEFVLFTDDEGKRMRRSCVQMMGVSRQEYHRLVNILQRSLLEIELEVPYELRRKPRGRQV